MILGVIGLGSIGYRHAMNLKNMGHQVFAYDPNITSMGVFNCSSFDEVCDKSEAIVIASPTSTSNPRIIVSVPFYWLLFVSGSWHYRSGCLAS